MKGIEREPLPGFRDFEPADCAQRNFIFNQWRSVAHTFGYEEFDGPIVEPLVLFTQKSGPEIVEQLFAFQDKGERAIALRPEMTPSLVRMVGKRLATLKRPTKWFNITEQFRYERPQKGRLRSFYQFNADIIGESSSAADAELIALAIATFQKFGLKKEHFHVRLSDRQLWVLWLKAFGVNQEQEVGALLGILDKWERRSPESIQEDLTASFKDSAKATSFLNTTEVLRKARTLDAIRECFHNCQPSSDMEALEQRLSEFKVLLQELENLGIRDWVTLDLTIVRGLAYYTGFVFEVFESGDQGRALAGGGRYDHLFEKLVGQPMPAVGFAAGDVTLTDLLRKQSLFPSYQSAVDCYVVFEQTERQQALLLAQQLRAAGFSVLYSLDLQKDLGKQQKKAYADDPHYVITLTHELVSQAKTQIKGAESEQIVDLKSLPEYLKQ